MKDTNFPTPKGEKSDQISWNGINLKVFSAHWTLLPGLSHLSAQPWNKLHGAVPEVLETGLVGTGVARAWEEWEIFMGIIPFILFMEGLHVGTLGIRES